MLDCIRRLSHYLFGPEPEPRGTWRRVGDNYAGCLIVVEQTGDTLRGRLVSVPDSMRNVGWNEGEVKWIQIKRLGNARYSLHDKYKSYDTSAQRIADAGFCDSRLRFQTEHVMLIAPRAADQGNFSRWQRVRTGGLR